MLVLNPLDLHSCVFDCIINRTCSVWAVFWALTTACFSVHPPNVWITCVHKLSWHPWWSDGLLGHWCNKCTRFLKGFDSLIVRYGVFCDSIDSHYKPTLNQGKLRNVGPLYPFVIVTLCSRLVLQVTCEKTTLLRKLNWSWTLHSCPSNVCLPSFSTGRLFPSCSFHCPSPPPFYPSLHLSTDPGLLPWLLCNNYYVNKYACCNHIRATDPIRELIAGGWLCGLAADGQGLCACLTGQSR